MPDAPNPTASLTAEPRIEYRQFMFCGNAGEVVLPGPRHEDSQIIKTGDFGLILHTGGNDFYPTVHVEAWPTEPPEQTTKWDVVEEIDISVPSGKVMVREWDGGPASDPLHVGPPGSYRFRAHSRGRNEAAARVGHDLYYHGVEQWLIQLWPAR
ncbi:hypothetical protein [Streptomyces sp. 8N616]|uniref:hypothetical protein n=1 Tax=Streptomyces sp. 8N616 TaxID=3457414 RepID=UPI003FD2FFEB